ncbi:hypothetical protein HXY33_08050 [Candidatus Bathyarchaeota archaeon]|nr:hypothetical protein [Candidatus Bathyarchaeota archaeon]
MAFKSKLKMENIGTLAAVAFYTVVGIVCFALLVIVDFRLVHIGIIGILSLITAYGLVMKRRWSIWLVIMLFFTATTFSAYTLYYYGLRDFILGLSMIAYLILTWVFTAYTATKRQMLEG